MNKAVFKIKKFNELNLGNCFRLKRKKLNLSLEAAADQISVSKRHLEILEKNNFSALPPEIYVKGFIRRYCELLGLDPIKAVYLFEKNKSAIQKDSPIRSGIVYSWFDKIVSYRNLVILIVVLLAASSLVYLFKVIYPMYAKPAFNLTYPVGCPFQTAEEKAEIKGSVQSESKIWINEEEVLADKNGIFSCPLFLKQGENIIRFKVVNKFGKERQEEFAIRKN